MIMVILHHSKVKAHICAFTPVDVCHTTSLRPVVSGNSNGHWNFGTKLVASHTSATYATALISTRIPRRLAPSAVRVG